MRLFILYPLALLAGFAAAAGPIARDDDPGVSELGSSKVPDFDEVNPSGPSGNAVVHRDDDELTKREGFNPLEARDDHNDHDWHKHPAILVACRTKDCTGKCIGYNLNRLEFKKCYEAKFPYSVFIISKKTLEFGVYVAITNKCRGVRIPKVSQCFHVKPYGTTFKWKKKHDDHW